jgi:hypothetical protein
MKAIRDVRHQPERLLLSLLAFACLGLIAVASLRAQTQVPPKPLAKDEVIRLLVGGVSPKRVGDLVRGDGIDFSLTPDTEKELRQAGADDELVAALRSLAPKASPAPSVSPPQTPATGSLNPSGQPLGAAASKNSSGASDAQNTTPKFLDFPLRFPVAHQHAMSWCYGYLSISPDKVRYDMVQPRGEEHSFEVARSEIKAAKQWVVLGTPLPVIELRLAHSTYHFRWLSNPAEVTTGGGRRGSPPDAFYPAPLIETINDPVAGRARFAAAYEQKDKARTQATPSVAPGTASNQGAADANQAPPPTGKKELQTDTQIFDFQFNMPHGWRRVETADTNKSARLEPANLPPGTAAILIFPGEELNGELRMFFDRKWAEYKRGFRFIREKEVHSHKNAQGFPVVFICANLQDQNNGKVYLVCFHAYQADSRGEIEVVLTTQTADESIKTTLEEAFTLYHSVRFVNAAVSAPPSEVKSTAVAPPPGPGNLQEGMRNGVYVGLQRAVYSFHIEHRFLYFFPDGWVMLGLPREGLDDFDFQAYRDTLRDKSLIGHYRVYGNRVDIIWSDSPDDREFHDLDESARDIHGLYYVPSCGTCKGTKLDSTYQWEQSTLQFRPDGTFVDRGCIDQVLTIDLTHPRFGGGTYRIGNYSLTLNYTDGHRLTKSFVIGKNAAWIAISEIMLHPLGYQPMP